MKIHLVSDLHADFTSYKEKFPECDVVVIAGDVSESRYQMREILMNNLHHDYILYVAGNHDFYGSSLKYAKEEFRELEEEFDNFFFLDNQVKVIDNVAFFGSTLWSDLNAYGFPSDQFKLSGWYPRCIADCSHISWWSADLMISEFKDSLKAIEKFVEDYVDMKKVCITHFAPSLRSVHERFKTSIPFNAYWCNNLDENLIDKMVLWCHGHVHNNFDYQIGNCHVVANPRGYVTRHGIENEEFNPDLILEI